jgi:hypothetical protein
MPATARYTPDLAERVLREVRHGRPLREACSGAGMPSARTVYNWVNDNHQGFAAEYRQAREAGRAPAFTPERAARILRELAKGRTPIDVCRDPDMPPYGTVRDWVRYDRHGFAAFYRQALRAGGARWARPTRYAADIADWIVEGLCEGRTLEAVCSDPAMPTAAAVRRWVREDRDGFAARYRRARLIGCDMLGEQMIDIADSRDDWIERRRADGTIETILDPQRIRRRRLQVRARYAQLSRLLRHIDDVTADGVNRASAKDDPGSA